MGLTVGNTVRIAGDLRSQISDTRDQGVRPLCLICAVSDAHEKVKYLGYGLSAEYLAYFCQEFKGVKNCVEGFDISTVSSVLASKGQPNENFHPYAQGETSAAIKPPPVEQETLYYANCSEGKFDSLLIVSRINASIAVVVGIRITEDFHSVTRSALIIQDSNNFVGNHAVLIVGYGTLNGELVFLIRNSWGVDWGFEGHAWVTEEYLNKYCMMMIEVESV